jgi:prepilin-type N-terminal cleavage/methylation domain-containing protein/prepilin-type processing-associated H-X9-DG protein
MAGIIDIITTVEKPDLLEDKMKTYPRHKKGFTLIEVLVVASIIGFILAIMFPIMGKARNVAKRATCVNNLRQLYFAMLSYVDDHNGTYPSTSFSIASLLPYMDNNKENTKCPMEDKYYDEGVISYGYNGNLAGIMWARARTPLPDTILFCDSGSAVITYSDEPDLNRHGRNLGQAMYADGHVGIVDTQYLVNREESSPVPTTTPPPETTPSPTTPTPTTPTPTTPTPTTPPPDGGGGGGGGGCFLAGTPVLMADRTTKPIEEIKVGDKILAYDEESGEIKPDKVKRTFMFPEEPGYLVINNHIKVTSYHRFLIDDGRKMMDEKRKLSLRGRSEATDEAISEIASLTTFARNDDTMEWKEAGLLKLGDKLLTSKDKLEPITSIEKVNETVTVYNMEVNPYHTFIAGGVVVHNARAAWAREAGPPGWVTK